MKTEGAARAKNKADGAATEKKNSRSERWQDGCATTTSCLRTHNSHTNSVRVAVSTLIRLICFHCEEPIRHSGATEPRDFCRTFLANPSAKEANSTKCVGPILSAAREKESRVTNETKSSKLKTLKATQSIPTEENHLEAQAKNSSRPRRAFQQPEPVVWTLDVLATQHDRHSVNRATNTQTDTQEEAGGGCNVMSCETECQPN